MVGHSCFSIVNQGGKGGREVMTVRPRKAAGEEGSFRQRRTLAIGESGL